ncbi:MAG: hypothetical protein J0H43_14780, partial [Actinobacteria bacterium]|nr:hypothetical protein [Actinomycetota bacterium]
GEITPKAFVVDQLIINQLLVKVVGKVPHGPTPTAIDAELAKESAGQTYTQRAQALGLSGYTESFYKIVMRVQLLQTALQNLSQAGIDLTSIVKQLQFPVSVSARYGSWDPKNFAFDGNAVLPSYLKLQAGQG